MNIRRTLGLFVLMLSVAIAMTWPLSSLSRVTLPTSDDAYFSTWRLAWVAHQLPANARHLFDANIFYPATGTLAYSDAMLLVGLAGAPFFWAGVEPARIHNGLLIVALALSAVAAYRLALRLTKSEPASIVAAVVFGFAPYRLAHIGHLELQWVVWMPACLICLHRLFEMPTWRPAVLLGTALGAQVLCSIYYGVFLSIYLAFGWVMLFALSHHRAKVLVSSTAAIVPLTVVALLYAPPYLKTRTEHGAREASEQARYSAAPSDFLRVPPENKLRGVRDGRSAPDERSLYVGAVPMGLALVALIPPVSTMTLVYGALTLVSVDASLGTNGIIFPRLQTAIPIVSSLRAPVRFGVLVLLSIAILAAIGAARIFEAWPAASRSVAAALIGVCLVEYWSAPIPVRELNTRPSEAHQYLASQPPGSVVLELPVPTIDALWLYETTYQLRSIDHWQPLVNGYSSVVPREYARTLEALRSFPSETALSRLRQLGVKFVLLNRRFYPEERFQDVVRQVAESPAFWPARRFGEGGNQIVVAELKP